MNTLTKKILFSLIISALSTYATAQPFGLNTLIYTSYPNEIKTVKELAYYILEGTGYQIYVGEGAPSDVKNILRSRLEYQRKNVLMTRKDALVMAAGEGRFLIVDDDNALITFTEDSPNGL